MGSKDIALIAHLMRRAGFGATYEELEARDAKGYEATVEELLDPDSYGVPEFDEFIPARFYPAYEWPTAPTHPQANVVYHLISSPRPLHEKMALFWHMLFATSDAKVNGNHQMLQQFHMFREYGLGDYRDLLVRVAKDPAMIFWLDNNENHTDAPNENWGRELLELFSLGVGMDGHLNYTEDDVKAAARAFTGWTMSYRIPGLAYLWGFEYKEEDHDDGEKVFLGHRGRFNGEDIVDIIVQQPATHRFIARHLYNFFVADEVQVAAWKDTPPRDPDAVNAIAKAFKESGYEIKDTLRFIFNSDFFKDERAWFAKVKNPAEVVAGTMRLVGEYKEPKPGLTLLAWEMGFQSQELLNPPSVEGWHYGQEWIDSGSLVRRVNLMADNLGDATKPGTRYIIDRLASRGGMSPEELVDGCLEIMGYIRLESETRQEYIDYVKAEAGSEVKRGVSKKEVQAFEQLVTNVLRHIASSKEYQFC